MNTNNALNDAKGWKSLGLTLLALFVIAWVNKKLAYGVMWVLIAILVAKGMKGQSVP